VQKKQQKNREVRPEARFVGYTKGDRMSISLRVDYAGLALENPLIVASASPTISYAGLKRAGLTGAGSLVPKSVLSTKTRTPDRQYNPRPRFSLLNKDIEYDTALAKKGALYSLIVLGEPYPTVGEFKGAFQKFKAEFSQPLILSLCAPETDYAEWQNLAEAAVDAGADALELSMHNMPYTNHTNPEIVRAVKKVVDVPVMPKLMVPWENPRVVGPALEEAGADAIVAMGNQPLRGLEIDVENEKFAFHPQPLSARGPWFRPVGLNWIAELAQCVNIPLSGVSGVASWKDVVKYILLGATTVQVCTAIYQDGYEAVEDMIRGLEGFMADKGYSSIEDFRGKMLDTLASAPKLPDDLSIFAKVDPYTCTGCKECVKTCFWDAITMEQGSANVNPMVCEGCGLCVVRCPVGAISLSQEP